MKQIQITKKTIRRHEPPALDLRTPGGRQLRF